MEHAANGMLDLDPERRAELGALAGRVIAVEFAGMDRGFYLHPTSTGLKISGTHEGRVHVTVRGAPADMLGYLAGTGESRSGIEISGDVELAQRVQSVLKRLDPDWEEALSRWLGDTAARKLGRARGAATDWTRAARRSLAMDASEYLRYESELVPSRPEVEDFCREVDALREDTDRLGARLRRLVRRCARP